MTAVLLDSVHRGATGWIAVRRNRFVRVTLVREGDQLVISAYPGKEKLLVEESILLSIPKGARFISVDHVKVASREKGDKGVCVDLLIKEE